MDKERSGETMKLGAFFHPTGNHVAAWLHPDAQIDAGTNFRHYAEITQTAERGKFDLMFVADAVATRDGKLKALSRWPQYMAYFDPLTLLPALAAVTTHVGLCATATTSYNEPYHIARKFASLDHISGGRAGWNVVTSSNVSEAFNFGRERHYEHDARYDRAIEFVEVVKGLWDSWDDDAFVRDRKSERYFDPAKLHYLNHKGEHFSVRGPLNVARPPQGHPVLFQAGSSEVGREVAARFAEGVFTPQHTLAGAQEFYRDLKERMRKYDRPPEALKVMPGLNAIVGRTRKEANELHHFLQSKIHSRCRARIALEPTRRVRSVGIRSRWSASRHTRAAIRTQRPRQHPQHHPLGAGGRTDDPTNLPALRRSSGATYADRLAERHRR